jgi:hypothetical protein
MRSSHKIFQEPRAAHCNGNNPFGGSEKRDLCEGGYCGREIGAKAHIWIHRRMCKMESILFSIGISVDQIGRRGL